MDSARGTEPALMGRNTVFYSLVNPEEEVFSIVVGGNEDKSVGGLWGSELVCVSPGYFCLLYVLRQSLTVL